MNEVLRLDATTAAVLSNLIQFSHIIIGSCVPARAETQTLKKMWYAPISVEVDDGDEFSVSRCVVATFRSGTSDATVEVHYSYPPRASHHPHWIGMFWQDTPTSPKMKLTADPEVLALIFKRQSVTIEPQLAK